MAAISSSSSSLPRHSPSPCHITVGTYEANLSALESPGDVAQALRALLASGRLESPLLPLPGSGATPTRFAALAEIAAIDLSLARLVEGHADARAILAEALRRPVGERSAYGVWAAEPPDAQVEAAQTARGWILRGRKRYASGALGLDRALVTARAEDGGRLFDLDLTLAGVKAIPGTWQAVGMAATESLEVVLDDVLLPLSAAIGDPEFYLTRPGFWHGAVGVAACWYGGALGALRCLRSQLVAARTPTDHAMAHLGAVAAICTSMERAAEEIDGAASQPEIEPKSGEKRALIVRHLVEQGCQEVLTRVGRAGGTSPLVFDRAHAKRAADLVVYLRQHHAERDLASLGRLVLETTS